MVRHALKHIFQKPTPDIDASDRTQQLRAKTIYAGTVDLAKTLANGIYKTYNGPYEVNNQGGNSNLVASRTYDDLLSITKGKVLLNQLPLNSSTQNYYQQNFAGGQMYEGNYNQFNPSFNFTGRTGCNNSVLVYDIGSTGFTGPASYDANGGFIGATGPTGAGGSDNNKHIFVDPNHCYYSDPCLLDASYTRFVNPVLSGLTGSGPFTAQQIISADQYRGFSYPMPNFNLTCVQQLPDQSDGPLFCPPPPPTLSSFTISHQSYGASSFQITPPTSNSPGTFTYFSSNPNVATIVGDMITIVGIGSSQITALQAASTNFTTGSITTTFTVNKGSPNLYNFSISSKNYGDSSFQITPPSSNSSGAFTYSSSNTTVATVVGDTITIVGAGSSQITALQAATTNFTSGSTSTNFTVNQISPTFNTFNIPSKNYGDSSFQITPPSSSSTGAFTYSSSDTSVATVVGNVVTIVGAGSSQITALQAATTNYTSGSTSTTFTVNPGSPNLLLSLPVVENNVTPFSFSLPPYTSSSNTATPFTYSSSDTNVATITGPNLDQITVIGNGTSIITVSQAAAGNYTSESFQATFYVAVKIYNVVAPDAVTKSQGDYPTRPVNTNLIFGQVNINTNDVLVNATMQFPMEYDNSKPIYLYFRSNTFLSAPVATVTFHPQSNSQIFTFPTPLTWTQSSGTYYTMWSQIDVTTGLGANPNLHMVITDENGTLPIWMWAGSIYKLP
jgi:hypothetical protein